MMVFQKMKKMPTKNKENPALYITRKLKQYHFPSILILFCLKFKVIKIKKIINLIGRVLSILLLDKYHDAFYFITCTSHVPGIPVCPFSPRVPFSPADPFSPSIKNNNES